MTEPRVQMRSAVDQPDGASNMEYRVARENGWMPSSGRWYPTVEEAVAAYEGAVA